MVTLVLPLSPQVDSFGLYCPVGCADSHTSLNTPKERTLIVIIVKNFCTIPKLYVKNKIKSINMQNDCQSCIFIQLNHHY